MKRPRRIWVIEHSKKCIGRGTVDPYLSQKRAAYDWEFDGCDEKGCELVPYVREEKVKP